MSELLAERTALLTDEDWYWYAASVADQIVYDEGSNQTSIQGFSVEMRMAVGMLEEHVETLTDDGPPDADTPGYQRFEALIAGREHVSELGLDGAHAKEIEFHQKEFGDFLWFLTNYLAQHGIHIADVARDYADAAALEYIPHVPLSPSEHKVRHLFPQELVWYRNSAQQLFEVVGKISNREYHSAEIDEPAKEALKAAAGQHLAAMHLLIQSTFEDVDFRDILVMNVDKVDGRRRRGTVVNGYGDGR